MDEAVAADRADPPDISAEPGKARELIAGSSAAAGKILIYIPSFSGGGAERVFMRLACRLVEDGYPAAMVVNSEEGPLRELLPGSVPLHVLGSTRSIRTLLPFARLLRRERPVGVVSALTGANLNAVLAVKLSRIKTRLVLCQRTQFSAHLRQLTPVRRFVRRTAVRILYPMADVVTGNTRGLASDIARAAGLSEAAVRVIPNPAPETDMLVAARRNPCPHPWFEEGTPVAVAIARLEPSKDYPTMLRAIARLKGRLRLIVLGEGSERARIERMIEELDLKGTVTLEGFRLNRFDYLVRGRMLVLSSIREGFPNALIEAVAAGIPCVSTDSAGGGPAEILGRDFSDSIVPVGDDAALGRPPRHAKLEQIASRFSLDAMTRRFLKEIGL